MTQTRIADDTAAIAQAMKDLGLEKSVPPKVQHIVPEHMMPGGIDREPIESGWQIHDDAWPGLAFADPYAILAELDWVEAITVRTSLPEGRWRDLYTGAAPAAVGMTEPV